MGKEQVSRGLSQRGRSKRKQRSFEFRVRGVHCQYLNREDILHSLLSFCIRDQVGQIWSTKKRRGRHLEKYLLILSLGCLPAN
jgi:hypothetical protein